ncbi:hypothetical protein EYR36_001765 [Pleurotus pulmonarius]|nr:hypothetical protein EYR36_008294 [Pleurotus pulmonarius]KAF4579945.1 hypothetical protein EYR36_001765 [Pleurotus pulmonarius]
MLLWKTSSFLLAALFNFAPATQTAGPIVDLGYARYQGSVNDTTNVTSYLGIRFAEPPVEDLRWRAPRPPKKVLGVQNATIVPPLCPQGFINISIPGGIPPPDLSNVSEDCLFLSVFAPWKLPPKGKKLPVIVWIHGGGSTNLAAILSMLPSGANQQNALLAISNTYEGDIFVDQTTADTVTAAQFVHDLYPRLNEAQVSEVARLYAGLGSPIRQADSIMGDTLFQCPTIWFTQAFRQSFKGEYAVLPAFHGSDISQYFPRHQRILTILHPR